MSTITVPLRREANVLLVGDTKLPLELVLNAYLKGLSAEQIATRFEISLDTIYTLLAYYHQNKTEMASYLNEQDKERSVYREQIETNSARMGKILADRKAQ